jgi:hypothetical protein
MRKKNDLDDFIATRTAMNPELPELVRTRLEYRPPSQNHQVTHEQPQRNLHQLA